IVERLGTRTPIPIEVVPFAVDIVSRRLVELGGQPQVREKAGQIFVSDNGNLIIDWKTGEVTQPRLLEKQIKSVAGVVDSGLFCEIADLVLVAGAHGVHRMAR